MGGRRSPPIWGQSFVPSVLSAPGSSRDTEGSGAKTACTLTQKRKTARAELEVRPRCQGCRWRPLRRSFQSSSWWERSTLCLLCDVWENGRVEHFVWDLVFSVFLSNSAFSSEPRCRSHGSGRGPPHRLVFAAMQDGLGAPTPTTPTADPPSGHHGHKERHAQQSKHRRAHEEHPSDPLDVLGDPWSVWWLNYMTKYGCSVTYDSYDMNKAVLSSSKCCSVCFHFWLRRVLSHRSVSCNN